MQSARSDQPVADAKDAVASQPISSELEALLKKLTALLQANKTATAEEVVAQFKQLKNYQKKLDAHEAARYLEALKNLIHYAYTKDLSTIPFETCNEMCELALTVAKKYAFNTPTSAHFSLFIFFRVKRCELMTPKSLLSTTVAQEGSEILQLIASYRKQKNDPEAYELEIDILFASLKKSEIRRDINPEAADLQKQLKFDHALTQSGLSLLHYNLEQQLIRYHVNETKLNPAQRRAELDKIINNCESASEAYQKHGLRITRIRSLRIFTELEVMKHIEGRTQLSLLASELKTVGKTEEVPSAITLADFAEGIAQLESKNVEKARAAFIRGMTYYNTAYNNGVPETKATHSNLFSNTLQPFNNALENRVVACLLKTETALTPKEFKLPAIPAVTAVTNAITAEPADLYQINPDLFYLRALHHFLYLHANYDTLSNNSDLQKIQNAIANDLEIACWILERQCVHAQTYNPMMVTELVNKKQRYRKQLNNIQHSLTSPARFGVQVGVVKSLLQDAQKKYPALTPPAAQTTPATSVDGQEAKTQPAAELKKPPIIRAKAKSPTLNKLLEKCMSAALADEKATSEKISELWTELKAQHKLINPNDAEELYYFVTQGLLPLALHSPVEKAREISELAISICQPMIRESTRFYEPLVATLVNQCADLLSQHSDELEQTVELTQRHINTARTLHRDNDIFAGDEYALDQCRLVISIKKNLLLGKPKKLPSQAMNTLIDSIHSFETKLHTYNQKTDRTTAIAELKEIVETSDLAAQACTSFNFQPVHLTCLRVVANLELALLTQKMEAVEKLADTLQKQGEKDHVSSATAIAHLVKGIVHVEKGEHEKARRAFATGMKHANTEEKLSAHSDLLKSLMFRKDASAHSSLTTHVVTRVLKMEAEYKDTNPEFKPSVTLQQVMKAIPQEPNDLRKLNSNLFVCRALLNLQRLQSVIYLMKPSGKSAKNKAARKEDGALSGNREKALNIIFDDFAMAAWIENQQYEFFRKAIPAKDAELAETNTRTRKKYLSDMITRLEFWCNSPDKFKPSYGTSIEEFIHHSLKTEFDTLRTKEKTYDFLQSSRVNPIASVTEMMTMASGQLPLLIASLGAVAEHKNQQATAPQETKQPSSAMLAKAVIRKDIGCGGLKEHEELVAKIYNIETTLADYYRKFSQVTQESNAQLEKTIAMCTDAEKMCASQKLGMTRLACSDLLASFEWAKSTRTEEDISLLTQKLKKLREHATAEKVPSATTIADFVEGFALFENAENKDADVRRAFISGIVNFNKPHPEKSAHSDLLQSMYWASLDNDVLQQLRQIEESQGTDGISSPAVMHVNEAIKKEESHFHHFDANLFLLRGLFKFQHHLALFEAQRAAPHKTAEEEKEFAAACDAVINDLEIARWIFERQRVFLDGKNPKKGQTYDENSHTACNAVFEKLSLWLKTPTRMEKAFPQCNLPEQIQSLIIRQSVIMRMIGNTYPFLSEPYTFASDTQPAATPKTAEHKEQEKPKKSKESKESKEKLPSIKEMVAATKDLEKIPFDKTRQMELKAAALFEKLKKIQQTLPDHAIKSFVLCLKNIINSVTQQKNIREFTSLVNEISDVAIALCKTHVEKKPELFREFVFFHVKKFNAPNSSRTAIRASLLDGMTSFNQSSEKNETHVSATDLHVGITLLLNLESNRLLGTENPLLPSPDVIKVTEAILANALRDTDLGVHLFFKRALLTFQQHKAYLQQFKTSIEQDKKARIAEICRLIDNDIEIACWMMQAKPTNAYWENHFKLCTSFPTSYRAWLNNPLTAPESNHIDQAISEIFDMALDAQLTAIRQIQDQNGTPQPESEAMVLAKKIMQQQATQTKTTEKKREKTDQDDAAKKLKAAEEKRMADEKQAAEEKAAKEAAKKAEDEANAKKAAEKAQKEQDRKRRKEENRLRSQQAAQEAARQAEEYRQEAQRKAEQQAKREADLRAAALREKKEGETYAAIAEKQKTAALQSAHADAELKKLTAARLAREKTQQASERKTQEAEAKLHLQALATRREQAEQKLSTLLQRNAVVEEKIKEMTEQSQLMAATIKTIATAREGAIAAAEAKIRFLLTKSAPYRATGVKLDLHPQLIKVTKRLRGMGLFATVGGGYIRDLLIQTLNLTNAKKMPYKLHSNGDKIFDFDINILSSVTAWQIEMIMRAFNAERFKKDNLDLFSFAIENSEDHEVYKFQIRISPYNELTRTDPMFADAVARDTPANTPCVHDGEIYLPLPQTQAFFNGTLKETQVIRQRSAEQKLIPGMTKSKQDLMDDPVRIPRLMIRSICDERPLDLELSIAMQECAYLLQSEELQKKYGANGENINYMIHRFNAHWFELLGKPEHSADFVNDIIMPNAFPHAAAQLKKYDFSSETKSETKSDAPTLAAFYERWVSYECFEELTAIKAEEKKAIENLEKKSKDEQGQIVRAQIDATETLKKAHEAKLAERFKPQMEKIETELNALKKERQDIIDLYAQQETAVWESEADPDVTKKSLAIQAIRREKDEKLVDFDKNSISKKEEILKKRDAILAAKNLEAKASFPKTEFDNLKSSHNNKFSELCRDQEQRLEDEKEKHENLLRECIRKAINRNAFYRCCFGNKIEREHIKNILAQFDKTSRKPKSPAPKPAQPNQHVLKKQHAQPQQVAPQPQVMQQIPQVTLPMPRVTQQVSSHQQILRSLQVPQHVQQPQQLLPIHHAPMPAPVYNHNGHNGNGFLAPQSNVPQQPTTQFSHHYSLVAKQPNNGPGRR